MRIDLHTHTHLCKHAVGDSAAYVAAAVAQGLDGFGLCDHIPMPDGFDAESRMDPPQFEAEFLPMVAAARAEFGEQIELYFGIEADFFSGTEPWVREFLSRYPFDYVIGSVHFIGAWGFDNPRFVAQYDERPLLEIYSEYYETVADSARSGLFDIVGHADLVKKFGHRLPEDQANLHRDLIHESLQAVRVAGMTVEVNTAGLRKPVAEMYPSETVLSVCRELGIPLTLGSDAHRPEEVGADFDHAVELVHRYGGGKIAVYRQRERRLERVS